VPGEFIYRHASVITREQGEKMNFRIGAVFTLALLSACASTVDVKPANSDLKIQHLCIQENPKADDPLFLQVLRDGFDRHGISTEVYSGVKPANCEYIVTYEAFNRWELTPGLYLRDAQIRIEKDGRYVSSASFHAGEGFVKSKWQSTKAKIDPLIDAMLAGARP